MKKIISLFGMFIVSFSPALFAATYYMPDDFPSLQTGFSGMAGGDTLIIRDGTYTGAANMITNSVRPPTGSSSTWTVIKAEHDGEVFFDGQDTLNMFNYTGSGNGLYWQFEGIIWGNTPASNVAFSSAGFLKFFRCGAFDPGTGNTINFLAGRYSFDALFENCYAWGGGRYKFSGYQADRIIFRACVARHDVINGWSGSHGEPAGSFSMYSVDDGEVQNCIAVDSDQTDAYINITSYAGAFCVPCTDMDANRINYVRCVALNTGLGGMSASRQNYDARNITFTDCVLWDTATGTGSSINIWRGTESVVQNCTFGNGIHNYYSHNSYDCCGENNTTLKNSIIYNYRGGTIFYDVENEDYNCLYNNDGQNQSGEHDITNINPMWNGQTNPGGALKYIVRIEPGSNLKGVGENGAGIGATAVKMVGKPGTLWGEQGYNEEQSAGMWPFPHEALIKRKMQAYSGTMNGVSVSGARGFAAAGTGLYGGPITLTSYIWERLGNPLPTEIYGADTTPPEKPENLQVK